MGSGDMLRFDASGTLPKGMHRPRLKEFRRCMVDDFQKSKTSRTLYRGYIDFSKRCMEHPFVNSHWVNGSYVTAKTDPNDLDISVKVSALDCLSYLYSGGEFLTDCRMMKSQCSCDVYIIPVFPMTDYRYEELTLKREIYWINWWGHTREKKEKGFVEFDIKDECHIEDVNEEYMNRGDFYEHR